LGVDVVLWELEEFGYLAGGDDRYASDENKHHLRRRDRRTYLACGVESA
jgi:hypothetical protein